MSDHLKFDTDFLDKDTPQKTGTTNREKPLSEKSKYNWKKILIISGVVLFFGWVIFSGSSDSTSTSNSTYTPTTNSNNLLTEGGNTFRCSDSNYNRAVQLKPSSATGAQLASESDSLDARIAANKAEKAALDAMYVDNTDQYALDSYNSRVDSYNSERATLLPKIKDWDARHTAFDSQIDTYNNFLDANCTPQ